MKKSQKMLGLKIDVDTARGTKYGVPWLSKTLKERNIKATFLFSLGNDRTGRAIFRIFRPGFFSKAARTNVLKIYGLKTLLNGLVIPGPHIGKKYDYIMKSVYDDGHEVGIHCYDHIRWQDHLDKMLESKVREEVYKAQKEFIRIFGFPSKTMGAAGWQANKNSLMAYDDQNFLYASDTRGSEVFFPCVKKKVFKTLQIPTTLPTLDELLGVVEEEKIIEYYHEALSFFNVLTIHAELEGMHYRELFCEFLDQFQDENILNLEQIAKIVLQNKDTIPTKEITQGFVKGRSGTLACSF
jgi:undecaprenyl phosphate-alpha-L-ara4FN deformylase